MGVFRNLFCLSFLPFVFSCNGNVRQDADLKENIMNETLLLLEPDSNKVFYKDELYANADNSFYDFIYLFKSDSLFQRSRIDFPLKCSLYGAEADVADSVWTFDSFFVNGVYYTQFYSSEKEIDEKPDLANQNIYLKELYSEDMIAKSYCFGKEEGKWKLSRFDLLEADNDDFVCFYSRFMNDSVFQSVHISKNIRFVTYDPDDEFSLIETVLSREQWDAFKPVIPMDVISEIDYGLLNSDSDIVIASTVQIDTGYNIRLHFRKDNSRRWILYKYEDLSN